MTPSALAWSALAARLSRGFWFIAEDLLDGPPPPPDFRGLPVFPFRKPDAKPVFEIRSRAGVAALKRGDRRIHAAAIATTYASRAIQTVGAAEFHPSIHPSIHRSIAARQE
jgi:hypothetical protein